MYNRVHQGHITCILILAFMMGASCIPLLSEQIGEQIFHESKFYVIYVCQEIDAAILESFNQFCQGDRLCAILDKEVDRYEPFRAFIGESKTQYFLILDVPRHRKYILPIIEGFSVNDLLIFQSKFQQGVLQPFYASEDPDPEPYAPCRKVVGKDLSDFLKSQTPVKVVFLYTTNEVCEACGQMLRFFADLAQKMYDPDIVAFAYYDVFRNDNPIITDQILPYFLIFADGKSEPYGLEGKKIESLYETIVEIVLQDTELDVTNYRKEGMEAGKRMSEGEGTDSNSDLIQQL